jgi:hypothetical protein
MALENKFIYKKVNLPPYLRLGGLEARQSRTEPACFLSSSLFWAAEPSNHIPLPLSLVCGPAQEASRARLHSSLFR